jgi:pimeloyl-ACP methyl ester carboxylesterase
VVSITTLEITGPHRSIPNTLFDQPDARHAAIVFPGLAYTCGMPLLWYSTYVLLSMGAEVLWAEFDYHRWPEFGSLSGEQQNDLLRLESEAAIDALLSRRHYGRVTLIGKSLGTVAMSQLVATRDRLEDATAVWLTPIVPEIDPERAAARVRSLFVIGGADAYYDAGGFVAFVEAARAESLVVDDADHILQVGTDPLRNLQIVEQVVRRVASFLRAG